MILEQKNNGITSNTSMAMRRSGPVEVGDEETAKALREDKVVDPRLMTASSAGRKCSSQVPCQIDLYWKASPSKVDI